MTDLERPEGWGFCWLRSCPCWESNGVACEEFVDDLGDPHPFKPPYNRAGVNRRRAA